MSKSLLYRLFGLGKIPAPLAVSLQAEGILLLEEGIRGSVTYLNFRAPGRSSSWRRQWYVAAIALTQARLVALRFSRPIINVPLTDQRLRSMSFSLEEPETLLVAFDAGLGRQDWSGTLEYRFRTSQAQTFQNQIQQHIR